MESGCEHSFMFPAPVKTPAGTKWGYINEQGIFVLAAQFDGAEEFQENGLAIVEWKGLKGMIDHSGAFIVKPRYQWIGPFAEGFAVAKESSEAMWLIDKKGRKRSKAYPLIQSYKENRAVFYQRTGRSHCLAGYLDSNGRVVIPPRFLKAEAFASGRALVQLGDQTHALIGLYGKVHQTYPFHRMGERREGLISFVKKNLTGYVNESGMVVISPAFTSGAPFAQGRAVVTTRTDHGDKSGIIDKTGAFIIPPQYDRIIQLGEMRAAVGKRVECDEMLQLVYAIADTENGRIFTDFIYDHVHPFQNGLASVTKGKYSFFIKKNGVPEANLPIFSGISSLHLKGNMIKAILDGKISYHERNGKLVYAEEKVNPLV